MTKIILIIAVSFLVFVTIAQNDTILNQRQTILQMRSNPACMVGPAAVSNDNPETPRRSI